MDPHYPYNHEVSYGLLFDSIQVYIWNKGFWAMVHKYHEVSKGQNLEDFSTRLEKIVSYAIALAFTTIVVHIHKLNHITSP